MPENEPAPEADALEQAHPVDDSVDAPDVTEIPPEVPEADALEQTRLVADQAPERVRIAADVPEADALEQTLPAGPDEDEDYG